MRPPWEAKRERLTKHEEESDPSYGSPPLDRPIDDYLKHNPGGQEQLIPLLHRVQESLGYVPFAVQEVVADRLGLSPIQVYGVVSFYHFFTTTPRGKYQLKVCMGTACFVRHAERLLGTSASDQAGPLALALDDPDGWSLLGRVAGGRRLGHD